MREFIEYCFLSWWGVISAAFGNNPSGFTWDMMLVGLLIHAIFLTELGCVYRLISVLCKKRSKIAEHCQAHRQALREPIAFDCHWNEEAFRLYQKKLSLDMAMGFGVIVAIAMLFVAVILMVLGKSLDFLCWMCVIYVAGVAGMALLPTSRMFAMSNMPQTICVTEDVVYFVNPKRTDDVRDVEDIQRVIDHGTFYELRFRFWYGSSAALLQKDQITKGTIEEFEALFEDKLERRT